MSLSINVGRDWNLTLHILEIYVLNGTPYFTGFITLPMNKIVPVSLSLIMKMKG